MERVTTQEQYKPREALQQHPDSFVHSWGYSACICQHHQQQEQQKCTQRCLLSPTSPWQQWQHADAEYQAILSTTTSPTLQPGPHSSRWHQCCRAACVQRGPVRTVLLCLVLMAVLLALLTQQRSALRLVGPVCMWPTASSWLITSSCHKAGAAGQSLPSTQQPFAAAGSSKNGNSRRTSSSSATARVAQWKLQPRRILQQRSPTAADSVKQPQTHKVFQDVAAEQAYKAATAAARLGLAAMPAIRAAAAQWRAALAAPFGRSLQPASVVQTTAGAAAPSTTGGLQKQQQQQASSATVLPVVTESTGPSSSSSTSSSYAVPITAGTAGSPGSGMMVSTATPVVVYNPINVSTPLQQTTVQQSGGSGLLGGSSGTVADALLVAAALTKSSRPTRVMVVPVFIG